MMKNLQKKRRNCCLCSHHYSELQEPLQNLGQTETPTREENVTLWPSLI